MSLQIVYFIHILLMLFANINCDRKVSAVLNPECSPSVCKKDEVILVHVKAEGDDDTLHHLWDFTGKPSLMIALTESNATLTVQWQSFQVGAENAVTFNPAPKYVYGTAFDKLIEFNDEMDSGALNQNSSNSSYVTLWDFKYFDWKLISLSNTTGDVTLTVEATNYISNLKDKKDMNGTIRFAMSAFGGEDHGETLPHLLHSGNASQVDVTLEHVVTKYKSSRFGLRLITVSSEQLDNTTSNHIKSRKTMDDEHAPGVFTIVEMVSPAVQEGGSGGYLQWRPVVYLSPAREMTTSTETVQYSVMPVTDPRQDLAQTLLYSALSDRLANILVTATNITFGAVDDGFYTKTNYAAWTMLAGYGHPLEEQFSMLVTLVLLIGLGLPAVLILTGTVCIVVRRLNRNKDDLFLSR